MNNQKVNNVEKNDPFSSYTVGSLVIAAIMFLSLFFGWSYIFNTGSGVEIGVNGWNYVCLSFTWYFKTTNEVVFGNVASFYYYVKYLVVTLTVLTMIAFYLLIALGVCSFINVKRTSKDLTTVNGIVSIMLAVVFLACFIVALCMGPKMIKGYCSNNPKCSVCSLAILPMFIALSNAILNFVLRSKMIESSEE